MITFAVLLVSYLVGSIPFSYLIPKLVAGIDVRDAGTHNVGAHNAMQQAGRMPGIVAGLLDAGKGIAVVTTARAVGMTAPMVVLAGCVAVVGHNAPVWLRFRGGRGLATSLGIIVALMPTEALLPLLALTVLYIGITHNIAFSTLVSFVALAGIAWWHGQPLAFIVAPLVFLTLMGVWQAPELWRMWRTADDKHDLIFNRWIFDRDAKL